MSNAPRIRHSGRYVVTDLGRERLMNGEDCACHIQLAGGLFTCEDCGTVWAKVSTVTAVLRAGGTIIDRS